MSKNLNRKCAGCGGNLNFSPDKQALVCDKCKSIYNIYADKNYKKISFNTSLENNVNKTQKNFNCPSCGAIINSSVREISTTCPYCNTNFVLNKENITGLKPNAIIPFTFNKQKAIEYFKKGIKKKYFLPNAFKKSPNLDKVSGTYISCFSFDSNTHSTYDGKISIEENRVTNGQVGRHVYTKKISGEKDYNFENVVIESSKLTNQNSFDQIKPFIFNDGNVYDYNEDFLRGYTVESYDNSLNNCKVLSENYIKQQIRKKILSNYSYTTVNYLNINTTYLNNKFSYVLLPVYFIDFKYKNKNYKTYINGQTGKVGDDLPKSKVKIFFTVLSILLIIGLIIGAVLYFD